MAQTPFGQIYGVGSKRTGTTTPIPNLQVRYEDYTVEELSLAYMTEADWTSMIPTPDPTIVDQVSDLLGEGLQLSPGSQWSLTAGRVKEEGTEGGFYFVGIKFSF